MNRYPWLDGYLMDRPGAEQDYKLEWQWQRYLVRGRMFAAVCTPGAEHKLHAGRTMIILKCDPRLAEAFRAQYPDVVPGFYSDKKTWNSVCDMSYALVTAKLTKTVRRELGLIP